MKVIILTCNKYSWLVPIFLHFYRKYWPDNPYQTEIVTETDHVNGTVFYNEETSWASRLINYLKQSKENKFLLFMEDFIIEKQIDTKRIRHAEELCKGNVGCVRVVETNKWFNYAINIGIKGFREYPLDRGYSLSLTSAIWQKQFLLKGLREGENAWQTECDGSKRFKELKSEWRILWSETPIINYYGGGLMSRGKVRLPVAKWALEDLIKGNENNFR